MISLTGECSDFLGEELHKEALLKYELNPKYCLNCGKLLSYDKRYNIFCNNRCSAIYNNKLRCGYKQKKLYCKQCGKEISMPNNSKRQFCSISCATTYRHVNSPITEKRKLILDNLDIIKERHMTESYRQIATDYGVSGQFIKEAIKGRLSK